MRTLTRVRVRNFLSLRELDVELNDLTVLVGPNGAGKSNFLKIFRFIGEIARSDLAPAIDALGGYPNLCFRGIENNRRFPPRVMLSLEGHMTRHASSRAPDSYKITFYDRLLLSKSRKQNSGETHPTRVVSRQEELILKRTAGRGRRITLNDTDVKVVSLDTDKRSTANKSTTLQVQASSSGLAILRRLGKQYEAPQVEDIASIFEELRLFDVNVDRARLPSRSHDKNRLRADASNIAAFLDYLRTDHPDALLALEDDISYVLGGFERFSFERLGGSDEAVRVDIKEKHLNDLTPLSHASFGTIRAIALFAMLHDPNPPKLTCLEEVDHGLHPHALDRLVERLRSATAHTQIIVATHSPALVNRLSADELRIFERDASTNATRLPDITAAEIREMEEISGYRLGELWFSGLLGGGL